MVRRKSLRDLRDAQQYLDAARILSLLLTGFRQYRQRQTMVRNNLGGRSDTVPFPKIVVLPPPAAETGWVCPGRWDGGPVNLV